MALVIATPILSGLHHHYARGSNFLERQDLNPVRSRAHNLERAGAVRFPCATAPDYRYCGISQFDCSREFFLPRHAYCFPIFHLLGSETNYVPLSEHDVGWRRTM